MASSYSWNILNSEYDGVSSNNQNRDLQRIELNKASNYRFYDEVNHVSSQRNTIISRKGNKFEIFNQFGADACI